MDRGYIPFILVAHSPLLGFLWTCTKLPKCRAFSWLYIQVSIGRGNRGNVKIYIPVLLVVHSPLCILREGAGASLLTRSCFLSAHPVLVKVKNTEFIDLLLDSAMAVWAVSAEGT